MCKNYHFFERCVFNNQNDLRKTFNDLKKSYYARIYNSRRGEWDLSSDMALVSSINDKGFSLIEQFATYWNKLNAAYREYYEHKNGITKTPLIFFMIDDADLKPQIINELIFSLPKYFSHPNVVVFISASQKTLNFTVKNFMYQQITKKEFDLMALMDIEYKYNSDIYKSSSLQEYETDKKIKFHELRYGKEYDKINTLTEEILRKLFPVCNRFYLKKYEMYEEKCKLKFEYSENKVEDISVQFAKKLACFRDEALSIHKRMLFADSPSGHKKIDDTIFWKRKSFRLLTDNSESISTEFYLSFLGKYPRDIVSTYYAFVDMLNEMLEALQSFYSECEFYSLGKPLSDNFISTVHDSCIKFLSSAIASNRLLKPFCKHTFELILERKMHWELYVNYPLVIEMLCQPEYIQDNKVNSHIFAEMICLLNFIEQLIILVIPNRKVTHGHIEFCQMLEICDINMIKLSDDLHMLFRQYSMYSSLNVLSNFDKHKLEHQNAFLDVVSRLNLLPNRKTAMDEIAYKKWYDLEYEVMFYRFSDISQIKTHSKQIFVLERPLFIDTPYIQTYELYIDKLKNWFYSDSRESSMDKREAYDVISNVDAYILHLIEAMNNITISFADNSGMIDRLESFSNELDNYPGFNALKVAFANFIDIFDKSNGWINRSYLINFLTSLNQLIPAEDYLWFSSWYRRLNKMFESSFSVVDVKDDDSYFNYTMYCDFVNDNISEFLDAVTSVYINKTNLSINIPSIKKMKEYYRNIPDGHYAKQYIDNLRHREWQKLLGWSDN